MTGNGLLVILLIVIGISLSTSYFTSIMERSFFVCAKSGINILLFNAICLPLCIHGYFAARGPGLHYSVDLRILTYTEPVALKYGKLAA